MNGYHVLPVEDLIDHDDSMECLCGPAVLWRDPITGQFYEDGQVVVVHHSLDGREKGEVPTDLPPGKAQWLKRVDDIRRLYNGDAP